MSPTILQIHFTWSGPFGAEMAASLRELAESINQEPGFVWKIWTESAAENIAGGIYLFTSHESASQYVEKHSARLASFGVTGIRYQILAANQELSAINHAPL
ncbi:monooxygenase [Shimwellia blattae]|uniref:Monooxygenase n=1 Tax=Shimwellia blattae (strain ATCC 29907 / DSM 4481 / JCM 1650 / NBRC 105725 / CDC 9005-74) TaxID=630626 RepID=I2B924_SHIBC|nr:monooxygenase [Shimwellia blattae]AFJ47028.1 hypothetical protein EBL_c19360 [Shimwellia blattae DSM 4481 = NBRC 105725]GAB80849.1 putative monooxygenase YdhR [Shimwellia blattae DSM 4481 = NBRC 105725]VDY64522.1 Putative monooxygenase ydhR [Shimwellia blattae]VEC22630.1 Putative monooxygenase ydhR [Shimwellia blattae]